MKGKALCHKIILVFLSVVLFQGCDNRPSNVLPEDQMVDLMADMQIVEAYSTTGQSMGSEEKIELGRRVLKTHGVSEETLDTTLAWYGRNMDEYEKLFEKVDKKISKRKEKYLDIPGSNPVDANNIWPYSEHLVLSSLSGQDAFAFSFPEMEVEKGEVLQLSFALANPVNMKTTFGVGYEDGHGEGIVSHNSGNHNSYKLLLYTDTLRKVSKVYGSMLLSDRKSLPLYIDSIKILVLPFDSLAYKTSKRNQKSFGPLVKKAPEKIKEKIPKDTVASEKDSMIKADSIKADSLR